MLISYAVFCYFLPCTRYALKVLCVEMMASCSAVRKNVDFFLLRVPKTKYSCCLCYGSSDTSQRCRPIEWTWWLTYFIQVGVLTKKRIFVFLVQNVFLCCSLAAYVNVVFGDELIWPMFENSSLLFVLRVACSYLFRVFFPNTAEPSTSFYLSCVLQFE